MPETTSVGASMTPDRVAQVGIAQRRAAGGVPDGRARCHHRAMTRHGFGLAPSEVLREPSRHRGVGDRLHAARLHLTNPLGPAIRRADARRCAGEHQAADAVRRVDGQPHRGQPAEREAAHMRAIRAGGVEHRQRVASEPLDRVLPGRRSRTAVAAGVVADHAKRAREGERSAAPRDRPWRQARARAAGRAYPAAPLVAYASATAVHVDFGHGSCRCWSSKAPIKCTVFRDGAARATDGIMPAWPASAGPIIGQVRNRFSLSNAYRAAKQ